jgi:hypothetical protein
MNWQMGRMMRRIDISADLELEKIRKGLAGRVIRCLGPLRV